MDYWLIIMWDDRQRRWKIALDETTFDKASRAYTSMVNEGLVVKLIDVWTET
jgi:hypothetical protein